MDLPSSVQETNLTVRLLINHWLVWIFWPLRTSTNSLAVYASQPPIFLSTGICNVPSAAYCTAQQPGSIYSTCSSSSKMERTLFICHMSYAQWTVFNWQAYPLIGFQTREANPNPFLLAYRINVSFVNQPQSGTDWYRLVQTGTGIDWYRLV